MSIKNLGYSTVLFFLLSSGFTPASTATTFEDHFTTLRPEYQCDKASTCVKDGTLQLKFKGMMNKQVLNNSLLFTDQDLSVSATCLANSAKPDEAPPPTTSLIFWATDTKNFYQLSVSNGNACIQRLAGNSRWLTPLPWAANPAINNEIGKYNVLRVVTVGSKATGYVNDQKIGEIEGQVPSGGGQIGVGADNFTVQEATIAFKDLVVK